ncbi:MAG: DNA polymerase III subunit chi [Burkholderiales bacterium]|nr:DNA polymerase III subunit chi [Burkholderiales bacterium]
MAVAVEFHTGVADKREFTCRLLRKAYRSGARVVVSASAAELGALDRELWTFDERDFVPHVRVEAGKPPAAAARTPIWLVEGEPGPGAPEVLVNLGPQAAADCGRFERVIEIVSSDPDDEAAGRLRWREYKARGLEIRHLPARRT